MSSGPEAVTAATEAASPARSSVAADTHVLIWYTTAPGMLSATAPDTGRHRRRWSAHRHRSRLADRTRLRRREALGQHRCETLRELLASIQASDSPVAVAPMTVDVAHHMLSVSRAQVRDPFDRAIVATAQAWGLPLLTMDSTLTRHFPELCVW